MRSPEIFLTDDNGNIVLKAYHSYLPPQERPYQAHHHTECELSFFLRGSGVYRLQNTEYEFHAGDIFLFGSNEAHCITQIHEEMNLLNFHFEPRILWEQFDCGQILNLFAARGKNFSNRFPAGDTVLAEKLQNLEQELVQQQAGCVINAKYLLFSALVHMIRHYDCIDPKKAISAPAAPVHDLKAAIEYIHQHLGDSITLKELADVAHLTPTYFSSLFKKFNGVSPWKYITNKRVELAISLLRTTSLSKLEIAERCGFSSSSNFYTAFTAVTGKTPSAYTPTPETSAKVTK